MTLVAERESEANIEQIILMTLDAYWLQGGEGGRLQRRRKSHYGAQSAAAVVLD